MKGYFNVNRLAVSLVAVGGVFFSPMPSKADSPAVRVITTIEAQATNGPLQTILLWPGSGININFIPTGKVVQRVWLDDPSGIGVDFDSPLCAPVVAEQQACETNGATVIHLRRIERIKFPNIPQTDTTLLTVVLQNPQGGGRELQQFRVGYGEGAVQYTTISINPNNLSGTTPFTKIYIGKETATLENIEQGLAVAKKRNLIGSTQGNQELEFRVKEFLARVQNGVPVSVAVRDSGVSMALISKLGKFGLEVERPFFFQPQNSSIRRPAGRFL